MKLEVSQKKVDVMYKFPLELSLHFFTPLSYEAYIALHVLYVVRLKEGLFCKNSNTNVVASSFPTFPVHFIPVFGLDRALPHITGDSVNMLSCVLPSSSTSSLTLQVGKTNMAILSLYLLRGLKIQLQLLL